MKQLRPNDMMLQVSMRLITLIIFAFSFYLFLAGHNNPGGGFIGGLMTASAILVLYLAFDMKTITKAIPFNFTTMIGVGLLFAVFTGIASMLYGFPFLTQFFDYFQFPVFGEVELTTALPFDLGVYLVVVGAALTIILAIAEDDK
ncbi:Na(+)/H(+) antiporter subunit B [Oceanobacillus polygoni]|uniref:Multicomponent Na+:H+ antiporter subunit B n=1 Tax=Oceanobacillus polygoni TaxID=1235259 RepID=A0A9X0YW72_9BACI|nr:Na(+)/H(+) antiporter subunit B [Oceanobacillus polygoni]MBP2078121.1 multicomponent Na+:H+ antiporter subunit B [Oceanobacillus polygoni]